MFEPLKQVDWAQGVSQPQDVEMVGAVAFTPGEVGYVNSSGQVAKALATGTTTIPVLMVSVNGCGIGAAGLWRPWGVVVNKDWTWTAGNKLYLSTATAGAITASAPTTYILPVGVALSATAVMFYPSLQNDYTPNTRDDDTTLAEGVDLILGTVTGTKIGTAVGQKLGFWNVTPVVQPAHTNQSAVGTTTGTAIGTTTGTAAGTTTGTAIGTTTGTAIGTTVITTAALTTAPYGYATQTQADDIAAICAALRDTYNIDRVRVGELIASYNIDRVRVGELIASHNIDRVRTGEIIASYNIDRVRLGEIITYDNQVRTGLVAAGVIKGSN